MADDAIQGLAVRIAMDDSTFNQGMQNLKRQLNVIDSDFKSSISGLKDWGKNLDSLKANAQALGDKINIQKQIVKEYQEQLDKSKAMLQANSEKMMDLRGKVDAARSSWEESKAALGANAEETRKLEGEYKNLSKQYESQESLVLKNAKTVDGYTIQLNNSKAALGNMEAQLKSTQKEIDKQSSGWTKLGDSLKSVGSKIKELGGELTNIGKKISTAFTAPIVGAGIASVKFAGDFEESANKVATIADTTAVSMEQIKQGVLDLSNNINVGATELNDAMYQVISATGDTANALGYVEIASKAAIGGFTDTTTAIDGLTSVMNAYGLKGKEAMQSVSDQMLVAQNYGKTTFAEIASGIGNVIPIAASLNVSTKDLFSSIAVLTKNGIATSESITGLKAALSNIIKPSSQAADIAGQLGIQFDAAHLKSVGWAAFLDEIGKKTQGNTEVMAKLFGSVEALNAATVLASTGSKDFAGALQAMEQSGGATEKAFETMNQGINDGVDGVLNSLKNLGISFGEILLPKLSELINSLQNTLTWFSGLDDGQKKFIITAAAIVAAIGPVITIIGTLTSGIGAVMTAFSAGAAVLAGGGSFGAALMAVITPAGLVVAAIVAIAVAAILIIKNWGPISTFFKNLWTDITSWTTTAWNNIKSFFAGLFDWLKGFFINWGPLILTVIAPFIGLPLLVIQHWGQIKEGLSAIWASVQTNIQTVWNGIKDFFFAVWNGIAAVVMAIVAPFANGLINIWNSVKSGISLVFEGIKNYFSGVWEVIKNVFLGAILLIVDLVTGNFTKLKSDAENIWNNIKDGFSKIWEGIKQIFSGALEAIAGFLKTEWDGIKNTAENAWNGIKTFLTNLWTDIKVTAATAWNGFKTWITDAWNSIVQSAKDIWNGLINWFKELPQNLKTIAEDMFNSMKSGVASTIGNVKTAIVNGITSAIDWIKNLPGEAIGWGRDMITGFINGIKSMLNKVGDAIYSVADKIRAILHFSVPDEGPLVDYENWMPDFMQGLADGIKKSKYKVQQAIQSLSTDMSIGVKYNAIPALTGSVTGSDTTNIQNSYGSLLHVGNITIANDMDIQTLAYKLEFYRQQAAFSKGAK